MKKKSNKLIDALIVIVLGVMLFSGYKLLGISREASESDNQFKELEQITQEDTPQTEETVTSYDKYKSIYELNNDFVGWIYIPDTPVDYPVMQTPQNPEYYLRRDFDGKYSSYGVPFVDYKCVVDQSDNTIIYSHNMLNQTMFSTVEYYADKNYWLQHRYIGFDTLNSFGSYEIALCARIDLLNTDFNYIETVDFADENQFNDYISKAKAHSLYETDVPLEYGDKLLLLSTCQSGYDDGRYIVIAKRISDEDLSSVISE